MDIDDLLDEQEGNQKRRTWRQKVLPEGVSKAVQEAPESRLIQFRVDSDFRTNVYKCARAEGLSLSEWVRRTLENVMREKYGIESHQTRLRWGDASRFKK